MTNPRASRTPGWPEVALDVVIALLLPKVGTLILALVVPPGAGAAAGMTLVLLAFFLIGKVRGKEGLAAHLARVVGILSVLTLILSREPLGVTLLGLVALAVAAALGGWAGSRKS